MHSLAPTDAEGPLPFAPATPVAPGKPEAAPPLSADREVAEADMEVAEVVAAAVAEALEQQSDAPCVKEVSVVLGEPADPTSREPTPVSVTVQHAE